MANYGDLEFQVLDNEKVNHSNTVTDKPVEDGTNVGDHIKNNSLKINATVLFSGRDINEIYNDLVKMKRAEEVYEYNGTLGIYDNIAIENFSTIKNAGYGNGFECTLSLKQIRIVETESIEIKLGTDPETGEQTQGESDSEGGEDKETDEDEIDEESTDPTTIQAITNGIKGFFSDSEEEDVEQDITDSLE